MKKIKLDTIEIILIADIVILAITICVLGIEFLTR